MLNTKKSKLDERVFHFLCTAGPTHSSIILELFPETDVDEVLSDLEESGIITEIDGVFSLVENEVCHA